MVYQTLFNKNRGFSLVEIVIVVAILAFLVSISNTVYNSFRSKSNLEIATNSIVEALRFAKSNTEQVNGDSEWGVYVNSNQVTVFSGSSFGGRDESKDKLLSLPGGMIIGGLNEIIFEKVSGNTNTAGTITVTGVEGEKNILINEKGTITY